MAKKTIKKALGFNDIDRKLDRMIDAMVTHEDLIQLGERLEQRIDKRFAEVMTAIDHLATHVSSVMMEYVAVKNQLARHEEWFKIIAKKNNILLPM